MQCVSDTWCATLGLTAIAIINSVFEHSPDEFATDEDCKTFTQERLDSLKFLYGDVTVGPGLAALSAPFPFCA